MTRVDMRNQRDEAGGIVDTRKLQALTNQQLRRPCWDWVTAWDSAPECFAARQLLALQHQHVQAAALDQRTLLQHAVVEAQPPAHLEELRRIADLLRAQRAE